MQQSPSPAGSGGSSSASGPSTPPPPTVTPPATSTEDTTGAAVVRYGYYSVNVREGSLTAMTEQGRQVRFTFAEDDIFSRDGLQIGLTTFERSWGRSLTVYTSAEGRRFDALQEKTPSGGLAPVAALSADGATVEVSYPYQPEVEWPLHAVHITTDDPGADDALWQATYSATAPALDRDAGLWRIRVAAPEAAGKYTYRVMTNLGKYRYEWAWGYSADPVEVTDSTPGRNTRYTGGWTIDRVEDDAVTASQGDITRTFALAPSGGTVPPDTIDLLEDVTPGRQLQVDYEEGATDNLVAIDGPAADGWPITAKDVRVMLTEDEITVSWTNPRGRAITGVRIVSASWQSSALRTGAQYTKLAAVKDPSHLRAGGSVKITVDRPADLDRERDYYVVLDGTQGVSSISRGIYAYDAPMSSDPWSGTAPPQGTSVPSTTSPSTAEPTSPPGTDVSDAANSESTPSASPTTSP